MTDKEKLVVALEALAYYGKRSTWQEKPLEEDDWILTFKNQIPRDDLDERRYGGKRAREAYRKIRDN